MQNKHRTELVPARGSSQPSGLGQHGAPGSPGAVSQTHSLPSPSPPTENRSSRRQVSESWTTCPFLLYTSPTDFSQAVVTRPVAELCGLPEITAAPWRAVVSLFPVSSGRRVQIKGSLFSGLSFILFLKSFPFCLLNFHSHSVPSHGCCHRGERGRIYQKSKPDITRAHCQSSKYQKQSLQQQELV